MAMENKRIIQLSTERLTLNGDDYVMVDSETDGSAKYRLDRLKETDTTLSVSGMAADAAATGQAISDETQARTQAVTAETQARQAADTALGKDVDDLKSAIENGGYLIEQSDIIQGSYDGTGAVVSNSNRIRPAQFIPVTSGGTVHFVPGENVSAIFYGKFNANKTFLGDGPYWFSSDFTTDWDGYMVCVYKNASNTAITPADYDAVTLVMTESEKEKYEQNKAALKALKDFIRTPTIRNGSRGNPANSNAISFNEIVPVWESRKLMISTDVPLESGYHYEYWVTEYSVESGNPASPSMNPYMIGGDRKIAFTDSAEVEITLATATKGIVVSLFEIDDSENCYPLRVANTGTNCISIYNAPAYFNNLEDKLYTQLNRETFAYIGNAGNFEFYYDNIFNDVGRCAWRLSSNSCCIKTPTKSVKEFTNAQIISSLTSDDLYTDASANTWLYLRFGYALVYDDSDQTLKIHLINALTPLGDTVYPLLMAWSGQMVGGLLYEKFLADVEKLNLDNVSADVGRKAITNAEVSHKLDNAQHIAHAWNATATPQLTILHFSDLHSDTSAMNRIITDGEAISDNINDIICTGDMVGNAAEPIASWWNDNVLTCIGNHDTASYNTADGYNWTALSMANRDAYYIAPFESNWGITHTSGTSYYYKDYSSQKVRLIVMDGMLYTNAGAEATVQTAWLEGLLSDAITNNLHVLIAIHAPHGGSVAKECSFSKYNEGAMPTWGDCNTPQTVIDVVATKITAGLKFIGYLVGHTHQDNIWDAENDGKQLMYCVTCAAVAQTAQWIASDQSRSVTEDAFNLVTIDTDHTLIKLVRGGGADIDDHMRTRKAICFNYSTGEKVGEIL